MLNWLADGHAAWMDAGKKIGSCAAVDAEVEEYVSDQDTIETWIGDCCELHMDMRSRPTELYRSYVAWCAEHGEFQITQKRFGERMRHRFDRVKSDGFLYYCGIRVANALSPQSIGFIDKTKT